MPRMFRSCIRFCFLLVLCLSIAVTALGESVTVKGGYLRMRNSPSTDAVILERYPTGTVLTVLGNLGEWMFVQAADGNKGYMLTAYLEKGAHSSSAAVATSGTAYITSSNGKSVNLRSRASKSSVSITQLSVGTKVTVLSTTGNWRKIKVNGNTGYVMSQYLSTAKVSPPADSKTSSKTSSGTSTGKVRSSNGKPVNMRTGPGKKYPLIDTYDVGTRVTILKKGTVWSYISINGQVGYMQTQYIR